MNEVYFCKPIITSFLSFILIAVLAGCIRQFHSNPESYIDDSFFSYTSVPDYSGDICISINNDSPFYTEKELEQGTSSFIKLSDLDDLGRCGTNTMSLTASELATDERSSTETIKPTGWKQVKYDPEITESDSPYLYNRCHILCHEFSSNDSEQNLITGTRAFNLAMLEYFEIPVIDCLEDNPDMHILIRSTPIFVNSELVCRGILLEAKSVEDNGASIMTCKYIYNIQPNVVIDYATGTSDGPIYSGVNSESDSRSHIAYEETSTLDEITYIGNKNSKKFHTPECENVDSIADHNKVEFTGSRDAVIEEGYEPARCCNP